MDVFTQRNFAAAFFRQKLKFTGKSSKIAFCATLWELGVTYTVHLWLVGKRVVDFLLALIELFSLALTVEGLRANIDHNFGVLKGVGHFEHKFQGEGGVVHQRILASKNQSPWAITWHCLCDPTFSRFDTILECDTQTCDHVYYTRG